MVNVTAGGLSQNESELEFTAEDVSKFDLVVLQRLTVIEVSPIARDRLSRSAIRH